MNLAITTTSARTWRAVKAHYSMAIACAGLALAAILAGSSVMGVDLGSNTGAQGQSSFRVTPGIAFVQPEMTYYLVESAEQRGLVLAEATLEAEDQTIYSPERHWKFAVLMAGAAEDEAAALSTIGEAQTRWAQAGASGLEVVDLRTRCAGC